MSNQIGAQPAGRMPARQDGDLGEAQAGLGQKGSQEGKRQQDPQEQLIAAFSGKLAEATAAMPVKPKLKEDELEGLVVLAQLPAQAPVLGHPMTGNPMGGHPMGGETAKGPGGPGGQVSAAVAGIATRLGTDIQALDQLRLSVPGGKAEMTLPLLAPGLGVGAARLVLAGGDMSVIFQVVPGSDAAIMAAAMQELAATLAQRFPNRAIRLLQEEGGLDDSPASDFNPFNEPVRRKT